MIAQSWPWFFRVGTAAGVLLLTCVVTLWVKRLLVRAGRRRQAFVAREGEARAEAILHDRGWAIEGRQVTTTYDILVEGEAIAIGLRADYLVERKGRRYVAEVKTGRFAPEVNTSATRRQLLEYRIAFAVDGVLLVDAESERVLSVEFPQIRPGVRAPGLAWALVIGLTAFGVGTWLAR